MKVALYHPWVYLTSGIERMFVEVLERKRRLLDRVHSIAGTEYLDFLEQFVGLLIEKVQPSGDAQWQRAADMPTARSFARAVPLGDAVYVVGGSPRPEASHAGHGSAVVERYRGPCE